MPVAMRRVQAVKAFRLASKRAQTLKAAQTPTRFGTELIPQSPYLLLPKVSSERRAFIPFGFEQPSTFCSDLVFMMPSATLFHFGVLSSTMHNAWVRLTCGRLKSDYRYSKDIVYNNYPWPGFAGEALTDSQRSAVEAAAQAVLDARAQFPGATLADLYDPLTMPPALLKAHQKLDVAVDKAYQSSGGKKSYQSDADRVAFLFELYQRITSLLPNAPAKPTRQARKAKA